MNSRRVRFAASVAVGGVVAGLLLGGCGAASTGDAPTSAASTSDASTSTPTASPSSRADAGAVPEEKPAGARSPASSPADSGPGSASGSESRTDGAAPSAPDPGSDGSGGAGGSDGSSPGLEMPEAPEPTVTSLAELLPQVDGAPLVTAPLPRAATAQGRLPSGFPDALRPTRGARVESSSVSPSGDRLQVGLVATSSRSPGQVLLAYRTRLARRGMTETAPPPSAAGSEAAAFRRGGSVITITVTPRGAGTSYSLHASLHASLRAGRG